MCNISDIYCIIINYAKLIVSVEMNPKPKKLLDRVRDTIRLKQYSNKTEGAYLFWIKQSLLFHDKKPPQDMAATEVEAFLTYLAVERKVAASTQNQALSAILFLYREVLQKPSKRDFNILVPKGRNVCLLYSQNRKSNKYWSVCLVIPSW